MSDPYENYKSGLDSPPRRFFAVTPDDATDLDPVPRQIIPATDGTIRLRGADDAAPVDYPALAGVPIVGRIARVYETGTTVETILAAV